MKTRKKAETGFLTKCWRCNFIRCIVISSVHGHSPPSLIPRSPYSETKEIIRTITRSYKLHKIDLEIIQGEARRCFSKTVVEIHIISWKPVITSVLWQTFDVVQGMIENRSFNLKLICGSRCDMNLFQYWKLLVCNVPSFLPLLNTRSLCKSHNLRNGRLYPKAC